MRASTAPHLSSACNYYVRTFANPAFDAESKREIMLLRPLFFASFLVHDLLAQRVGTDADTIAITSASRKRPLVSPIYCQHIRSVLAISLD
jgi:hypothetical protein